MYTTRTFFIIIELINRHTLTIVFKKLDQDEIIKYA